MGSVEVGGDGGWLPHPEEQLFLDELFAFMERQGSPIHKVPNLGFKKSEFWSHVTIVLFTGGHFKQNVDFFSLSRCP